MPVRLRHCLVRQGQRVQVEHSPQPRNSKGTSSSQMRAVVLVSQPIYWSHQVRMFTRRMSLLKQKMIVKGLRNQSDPESSLTQHSPYVTEIKLDKYTYPFNAIVDSGNPISLINEDYIVRKHVLPYNKTEMSTGINGSPLNIVGISIMLFVERKVWLDRLGK